MSLAGTGAVAIWHDIAPEGREDYYAWHGTEHMPERVGIPGFLRGRRYFGTDGSPEYFNLYETETPAVVTGKDYLARLNAPTPWTLACGKHFRNVSRSLCMVAASHGEGHGGLIATYRYAVDNAQEAAHQARMVSEVVLALAARPGVAGCHLLIADEAASAVETAEKRVRTEKNLIPRWSLLLEGWGDEAPFRALAEGLLHDGTFAQAKGEPELNVYRLQNLRTK